MKVKGPISDPLPSHPARDLDVITFRKTDLSREMIKGDIGTVVSVYQDYPGIYLVQVNTNNVQELHRSEFRLATAKDIARSTAAITKKKKRADKNGTEMEFKFRIPEFPGDPKI